MPNEPQDQETWEQTHARWAAEHIAQRPGGNFTAKYRALAASAGKPAPVVSDPDADWLDSAE